VPVYEYKCPDNHRFTVVRPMSESSKHAECPECGKPAPREITAPQIKGGDTPTFHEF